MSSERQSEKSEGKTPRVPMGGPRLRMQLSDDEMVRFKERKKVTHWFNDAPGRIERAKGGGYTFVNPIHAQSLGQGALHKDNSDPSKSRVSIVVNSDPGQIVRAYLMEIDEKYYKEDQATKEKKNQMVDDALAAGGAGGATIERKYGDGVTYGH